MKRSTPLARGTSQLKNSSPMKRTSISSEPKPAKGPKQVACRNRACRKRFVPDRPFVEHCSPDCGVIIGMERAAKQKAKDQRADRRETKRKLEKFKTRSDFIKDAQYAFNRYVRLRAVRFGHACISSGAPLIMEGVGGGFDAGHYRSIGSAPHLRFNLNNCWGQSKQDNRYGAGASFEYRRGLIARRGLEVVEALEADDRARKFDIVYLVRIKQIFDRKFKRLERRISRG